MTIKPIRDDNDLRLTFSQLEQVFHADEGTPEADEREILVTLIEAYENRHYSIGPTDPVEAIKFRMEQQGLTPRDLGLGNFLVRHTRESGYPVVQRLPGFPHSRE